MWTKILTRESVSQKSPERNNGGEEYSRLNWVPNQRVLLPLPKLGPRVEIHSLVGEEEGTQFRRWDKHFVTVGILNTIIPLRRHVLWVEVRINQVNVG